MSYFMSIGSTITNFYLGFPVIMIALIPFRWNILPRLFTAKEFRIMDAPTANNTVVLASLGGKPRVPEVESEEQTETGSPAPSQEDKWSAAERGVERSAARQRVGAYTRE